MSDLAAVQRALAAGLVGLPTHGLEGPALAAAVRSLRRKRMEAVRRILPDLWATLGGAAAIRFTAHAGQYRPRGLLPHVDDAWSFAEWCRGDWDPAVRLAARRELFHLRLHFRRRAGDPRRVRERRGPFLGWDPARGGGLVLRVGRRLWRLGWPGRGVAPPATE